MYLMFEPWMIASVLIENPFKGVSYRLKKGRGITFYLVKHNNTKVISLRDVHLNCALTSYLLFVKWGG